MMACIPRGFNANTTVILCKYCVVIMAAINFESGCLKRGVQFSYQAYYIDRMNSEHTIYSTLGGNVVHIFLSIYMNL